MSVTAAPVKTISPAPAKNQQGLGEFAGKDFSDPEVRKAAYERMTGGCDKGTSAAGTFAQCCGSAVFDAGGMRAYPLSHSGAAHDDYVNWGAEYLPNDGTYESVYKAFRAFYNDTSKENYLKRHGRHMVYDYRSLMATGDYSEEDASRIAEEKKVNGARVYTVADRYNLIFSWDYPKEEAVKKWFPGREDKVTVLEMDDKQDGKAILLYVEESRK